MRALETAGPVFIKAGQMMAARPDLLSLSLSEMLGHLHDRVRPFPYETARAIVEMELRRPIDLIFREFTCQPCAAGSMAQVHRAVLFNGAEVAVKIQRPNLPKLINADLSILRWAAWWAERLNRVFAQQRLTSWVDVLARLIADELDFTMEAANQERFIALFAGDPTVKIPRIHKHLSARRVLVMDYLDGIPINRIEKLRRAGLDPAQVARHGADCTMKQVFEHGLLHCDPHPGNLLVLPGNVIGLIDFGQVVRLTSADRRDLRDLLSGLVRRDAAHLAKAAVRMAVCGEPPDIRELERDTSGLLDRHLYKPLNEIQIGHLLADMLQILLRHRMRMRACWFPIMKEISAIDQVGKALDPAFDMVAYAAPHVRFSLLRDFIPLEAAACLLPLCGNWLFKIIEQVFPARTPSVWS